MKKLAVFVEGYTEVLFIEKLIEEIAGRHDVLIEARQIRGGSRTPRYSAILKAIQPNTGQRHYVLIIDCGGDRQVKSRIIEEHEGLTHSGFLQIIGLRDVRPDFVYADIPRLEMTLRSHIRTSLIPVEFILAVMEIEAWFLSETSHFERIDPSISVDNIRTTLGFDPDNDNLEQRAEPCVDLNNCYSIAGKSYQKKHANVTVSALDYASVYLNLINKFAYLNRLTASIDTFLTDS